jgi:hypothetical protein
LVSADADGAWHVEVTSRPDELDVPRKRLIEEEGSVDSRVLWKPMQYVSGVAAHENDGVA